MKFLYGARISSSAFLSAVLAACTTAAHHQTASPTQTPSAVAQMAGQKVHCSGTNKSKEVLSWQPINLGGREGHQMVQFVRVDTVSSQNPEFDGGEVTVYAHIDQIAGTGTVTGYSVESLRSGDKLWTKFESTQYNVVTKGPNDWEIHFISVFQFIAGTGKYKNIRGGGHNTGIA